MLKTSEVGNSTQMLQGYTSNCLGLWLGLGLGLGLWLGLGFGSGLGFRLVRFG